MSIVNRKFPIMAQPPDDANNKTLVISYLTLRKAIGLLGFFLPLILWMGVWMFDHSTVARPSISDYYYTHMRNSFVGILCAVSLFLYAYNGYDAVDRITGYIGSILALGVAFFPTTPGHPDAYDILIGRFHLGFAGLFFCTLIFFSLFLFTRTHPNQQMTERKKMRNTVYYISGFIMLGCVLAIALYELFGPASQSNTESGSFVFWCESIALMSFGVSWLVKGEIILKDINHH